MVKRLVARGDFEVVIPQLDANGFGCIALALQICSQFVAQLGKYAAKSCLVTHRVQVFVKRGFAAHADGLAAGNHGAVVPSPGHLVHPRTGGFAKALDQKSSIKCCQLANGLHAKGCQLFIGFGADAVDFAAGKRPDFALQVFVINDRNAIGLVELTCHFGQQLVGCHANGATQARCLENLFLNQARQHAAAFTLASGHLGEVYVHLINAPVFHQRRNLQNDFFKQF